MRGLGRRVLIAAMLAAPVLGEPVLDGAAAADRHVGYYYPEPGSREVYEARSETLEEATRSLRVAFVTGITNDLGKRPYPAQAAIFAKGAEAEKLIIVALADGRIDTIYRARALFANLTASARLLPIFAQMGVQEVFTFFDLAKMMGFAQITITNGRDFAHQVILE